MANWAALLQQLVFGFNPTLTNWTVLVALLPAWLLGVTTGYWLLPRPDNTNSGDKGRSVASQPPSPWVLFFSGPGLRRFALLYQLGLIIREIWVAYTAPGTFRALNKAVWQWCCGKGFDFQPPAVQSWANFRAQYYDGGQAPSSMQAQAPAAAPQQAPTGLVQVDSGREWYVTGDDLGFFKYTAEQDGEVPGASAWEQMMDKDLPNQIKYTSWRRTLANGKTEYKSITISPDATAQEFTDLYFDDDFRPTWDTMIVHREVLEHGDFDSRQQVVRWIRRFPFKFLSDREYAIARRFFREGDALYGITKSVPNHPAALRARDPNTTQMDVYYSMWRSRTVPCPWGSGRPAVETLLLHHEQFKIPEHLARFAVRHGMWGFVKGLSERVPQYVAARRARGVDPFKADPMAFGAGHCANPPTPHGANTPLPSQSPFAGSSGGVGGSPLCMSRAASMQPGTTIDSSTGMGMGGRVGSQFHLSGSCLSLASLDSTAGTTANNFGALASRISVGRNLFSYDRQSTNGSTGGMPSLQAGLGGPTHGMLPTSVSCQQLPSAASVGSGGGYYQQPAHAASVGTGLASAGDNGSRRNTVGGVSLPRKVRGILAMALAGGVAVAFKRSSSMPNLGSGGAPKAGHKAMKHKRHEQRRQQALGPAGMQL